MLLDSTSHPKRQAIALFSFLNDSTANNLARQTGEMLAKLGWQVDIFVGLIRGSTPKIIHQSPHCRLISLAANKNDGRHKPPTQVRGSRPHLDADTLQKDSSQFIRAFEKFQTKQGSNYPIIHTFDWLAGWVGLQLKNQIDLHLIHTFDSFSAPTDTQQLIQRQIAQTADRLIVIFEERDRLPAWLPLDKVEVLPSLRELDRDNYLIKSQSAIAAKTELGLSPSESIILYAGKFASPKNLETLIRAFHNCIHAVTKARLVLLETEKLSSLGSATKQYLQQLVGDLGLAEKVLFVGQVDPELLSLYYTAADVGIIPSQEEPLSKAALEAAAWNLPVIAANEAALRFTVVPQVTGLLVPSKDTSAWQRAIAQILSRLNGKKLIGNAANYSKSNLSIAHFQTDEINDSPSAWSRAKIAIYLSYLYRYLLAGTLTNLEWTSPLVPWHNIQSNPLEEREIVKAS